MNVTLLGITQDFSFGDIEVASKIRMRLPNGRLLFLEVSDEQVNELISASEGNVPVDTGSTQVEEAPEGQVETNDGTDWEPEQTVEKVSEEAPVDWMNLADDVLAPAMKQVMVDLGVAAVVPMDDLVKLIDDISERMAAQAAETLSVPPQPAPQPQPQLGKVQPQLGKVQLQQVPRPRTVPQTDMGYPVVTPKPGQPETEGVDEDGVVQL